jgi:hypothetical protein
MEIEIQRTDLVELRAEIRFKIVSERRKETSVVKVGT